MANDVLQLPSDPRSSRGEDRPLESKESSLHSVGLAEKPGRLGWGLGNQRTRPRLVLSGVFSAVSGSLRTPAPLSPPPPPPPTPVP